MTGKRRKRSSVNELQEEINYYDRIDSANKNLCKNTSGNCMLTHKTTNRNKMRENKTKHK